MARAVRAAMGLVGFALCARIPADPARDRPDVVHAWATGDIPPGRVAFTLRAEGRRLGDGVALTDGDRLHVALRNTLGQPVLIARSDGGALGVELVGDRELVALDASRAVELVAGIELGDLARAAFGGAPRSLGPLTRDGAGWRGAAGRARVRVDAEGRLLSLAVAGARLDRTPAGFRLDDGGLTWEIELGTVARADLPERAFRVGEARVPVVPVERVPLALAKARVTGG